MIAFLYVLFKSLCSVSNYKTELSSRKSLTSVNERSQNGENRFGVRSSIDEMTFRQTL